MLFSLLSLSVYVAASSYGRVTHLPGFGAIEGNNTHYSGYLDVEDDTVNFKSFFYYTKHSDPSKPLLVWMNGGPGASSLMGLFTELGPHLINEASVPKNGSAPWTLFSNPHAWSEEASLLVWEQPAGVGFSRCTSTPCPLWNDESSAKANLRILLSFYQSFPAEIKRDLFLTGESYGGIYVPMLALEVHMHNIAHKSKNTEQFILPLKGVAMGNGCIGYGVTGGCGLDQLELLLDQIEEITQDVSSEAINSARVACQGQLDKGLYPHQLTPPCHTAMRAFFRELGHYNTYHWSSPCGPDSQGNWGDGSSYTCVGTSLTDYLATAQVQRALNVIPDTPSSKAIEWKAWDGDWEGYNITLADAQPIYRTLLKANYSMLIYNGLRDTGVPALGAKKWLPRVAGESLSRRKWALPGEADVAGHVYSYEGGLRFVTLQGAGHLVPGDRPEHARAMIAAFLSGVEMPVYEGDQCTRLWLGRGYGDFCGSDLP